ncbi:MAG TPA: hypothetical protein VEL28_17865 [Candidatus Binatia bacterium]|nr:hypothetical protein [Candidatus Binatia bacterium]
MTRPVTPLHQVKVGAVITPKLFVSNDMIKHLTFARECADVGAGLMPGTAKLEIVEISPMTLNGNRWLKAAIVGTDPPRVLKLTAQEYMGRFAAV